MDKPLRLGISNLQTWVGTAYGNGRIGAMMFSSRIGVIMLMRTTLVRYPRDTNVTDEENISQGH